LIEHVVFVLECVKHYCLGFRFK